MKIKDNNQGHIHFIVNPQSGNGKSLKLIPGIENYLNNHNYFYKIHYTEYKGHAIDLARMYQKAENVSLIIAVGGDGTINEVINGLYPTDIPIGYIPAGSGNDYARELGIPKDPIQALENLLERKLKKIDIGKINNRFFVNVASLGFDGEVAKIANSSKLKGIFGRLVYVYGVIKGLLIFKPKKIDLIVDNKKYSFNKVWMVAVANHRYYGGGMIISPKSVNIDGELDICIIKDLNHLQLLVLFPTIFFGNHIKFYPKVELLKGKQIEVNSNEMLVLQADGEIFEAKNVNLEVIKQGLQVII